MPIRLTDRSYLSDSHVRTFYIRKGHKKVVNKAKDYGPPADITGTVAMDILRRANISEEQANRDLYREEKVDYDIDRNDLHILRSSLKSDKALKNRKGPKAKKTSLRFYPMRKPPRLRGPYRVQRKRMRKPLKRGTASKKEIENQENKFYRNFMKSLGLRYLEMPRNKSNETLQLSAKTIGLEPSRRQNSINIILPNKTSGSDKENEVKTQKRAKTELVLNEAVDIGDIKVKNKNTKNEKNSWMMSRNIENEFNSSLNINHSTKGKHFGKHGDNSDKDSTTKNDTVTEPKTRTKMKASKLHKNNSTAQPLDMPKSEEESAKSNRNNYYVNDFNQIPKIAKGHEKEHLANRLDKRSSLSYDKMSGESTTNLKMNKTKARLLDRGKSIENDKKSYKRDDEVGKNTATLRGNKEILGTSGDDRREIKDGIKGQRNSSKETEIVPHKDKRSGVKPITIVMPKRTSSLSLAPKQGRLPSKENSTFHKTHNNKPSYKLSNDALNKSKQVVPDKSRDNDHQYNTPLQYPIAYDNKTHGFKVNHVRNDVNSDDRKAPIITDKSSTINTNETSMNKAESQKNRTSLPKSYHKGVTLPLPKVLSSNAKGPLTVNGTRKKTTDSSHLESNEGSKAKPISLKELTRSVRNIKDESTRNALTSALEKDEKKMQKIANDIRLSYERKKKPFSLSRVLRDLVRRPDIPDEDNVMKRSESRDKTLVRVKRVRRNRPLRGRGGASDVALVRVKRIQKDTLPLNKADKTLIRVKRKELEEPFDKSGVVNNTHQAYKSFSKGAEVNRKNDLKKSHLKRTRNSLADPGEIKESSKEKSPPSKQVALSSKQRIGGPPISEKELFPVRRIDPHK